MTGEANKKLSRKTKAALAGLMLVFVIPWVAVFILEFFYVKTFPAQVFIYKPDFCFFMPKNCQAVENTSGELNFYCSEGQSAQLSFLRNAESLVDKSVVLKNYETIEVEHWEIQYEANVFKLTSKKVEDKKFVKPISCSSKELVNQQGSSKDSSGVAE